MSRHRTDEGETLQTPDEWLADFESKVADLQQKATRFKENLESAGTTERAADGSVTVTVAPNGSLTDLRLSDDAMRKSADDLAAEIMALTRTARQTAATSVAEAFVPLGGDRATVQHIPAAGEAAPEAVGPGLSEVDDDEEIYQGGALLDEKSDRW